MDLCLISTQLSLDKTLIHEQDPCWLLVDCCNVFISCLDSQYDGTHSLDLSVIKWYNATFFPTHLHPWWFEGSNFSFLSELHLLFLYYFPLSVYIYTTPVSPPTHLSLKTDYCTCSFVHYGTYHFKQCRFEMTSCWNPLSSECAHTHPIIK